MRRAIPDRSWEQVQRQMEREENRRRLDDEMEACSICGADCRRDGDGTWVHIGPCDEDPALPGRR